MFSIFMKLVAIAHARIASPPAETSLMCQYASSQTDVRSLNDVFKFSIKLLNLC
jgi:hypothetical protein